MRHPRNPRVSGAANRRTGAVKGELAVRVGEFERGTRYDANQVEGLVWVFATLWETSALVCERLAAPYPAPAPFSFGVFERALFDASMRAISLGYPLLPGYMQYAPNYFHTRWRASGKGDYDLTALRIEQDLRQAARQRSGVNRAPASIIPRSCPWRRRRRGQRGADPPHRRQPQVSARDRAACSATRRG